MILDLLYSELDSSHVALLIAAMVWNLYLTEILRTIVSKSCAAPMAALTTDVNTTIETANLCTHIEWPHELHHINSLNVDKETFVTAYMV